MSDPAPAGAARSTARSTRSSSSPAARSPTSCATTCASPAPTSAASTGCAGRAPCCSTTPRCAPAWCSPCRRRGRRCAPWSRCGRDGELSDLQQAFADHHGLQCGFCTPGFLMLAEGVLAEQPDAVPRGDPRGALGQPVPLHRLPDHRRSRCARRRGAAPGGCSVILENNARRPRRPGRGVRAAERRRAGRRVPAGRDARGPRRRGLHGPREGQGRADQRRLRGHPAVHRGRRPSSGTLRLSARASDAHGSGRRGGRRRPVGGSRPPAARPLDLHTDLLVRGKIAQFGKGAITTVSSRLLDQFARNLAGELLDRDRAPPVPAPGHRRCRLRTPRPRRQPPASPPSAPADERPRRPGDAPAPGAGRWRRARRRARRGPLPGLPARPPARPDDADRGAARHAPTLSGLHGRRHRRRSTPAPASAPPSPADPGPRWWSSTSPAASPSPASPRRRPDRRGRRGRGSSSRSPHRRGVPVICHRHRVHRRRGRRRRRRLAAQGPGHARAPARAATPSPSTRGSASPPDDHRILKKGASAFHGSSLAALLAGLRIDTAVVCGATTRGCVRATAVDAVQSGFDTLVVAERVRRPRPRPARRRPVRPPGQVRRRRRPSTTPCPTSTTPSGRPTVDPRVPRRPRPHPAGPGRPRRHPGA